MTIKTFNLENLFEVAKGVLLKLGTHPPTLFVETKTKVTRMHPIQSFWNSPTPGEREKGLFFLARQFSQETGIRPEDVRAVFLVAETWVIETVVGTQEDIERVFNETVEHPEDVPGRKEALNVWEMAISEDRDISYQMHVAEVIRAGDTIDLLPFSNTEDFYLDEKALRMFYAGIISGNLSNQELLEMYHRFQEVGEI